MDYTSYPRPLKKHRDTFIYGLMDDLVEYGLSSPVARSVAGAVCELMSRDDLYYHNYIHPLAMFDFARNNGIELSLSDRLAVWFHDCVYVQGAADNELRSSEMFAALVHKMFDQTRLKIHRDVIYSIDETSLFLRPTNTLDGANLKILDLDLHSFALPYEDFKHCAELVQKELGTTPQQTIGFYDLLLARAPIFRTEEFSRFEQTALDNIQRYKFEHANKVTVEFKDIRGGEMFLFSICKDLNELDEVYVRVEDNMDLVKRLSDDKRFWVQKDVECLKIES